MANVNVTVKGIPEAIRRVGPEGVEKALRAGLPKAGLLVQAKAQHTVHSPTNPYIGKAGHSVATGRLQASIGTSPVRGHGIGLEIAVGTPYGKGGLAGGTFARSASRTLTGRPGSQRTRTGGRKNRGDVAVYGPIEEKRHPFLAPAVESSTGEIERIIDAAIEAARP